MLYTMLVVFHLLHRIHLIALINLIASRFKGFVSDFLPNSSLPSLLILFSILLSPSSRASVQIEDGEIYASINQKDGMVCFHDNPEKYNNPAMLHKIDQEVSPSLSVHSGVRYNDVYETWKYVCYLYSKANVFFSPFRC